MAAADRKRDAPPGAHPRLIHTLVHEAPHRFSFFQAVFLLERYAGSVGRLQFRTVIAFCRDLEDGKISDAFQREFESHGIFLSNRLAVSVAGQKDTWLIIDEANGKTYRITRSGSELEVYARGIARVGNQGPVALEAIRFRPDVSLAFPVCDIASIEEISTDEDPLARFCLTDTFLGVYGTNSPLPDFYTEDILWSDTEESYARDFLDIFHHRLTSLFYRSWLKYRYCLQFGPAGRDTFSQRLLSLVGMGTPALKTSTRLPSVRFLRYAGLIGQQPKSTTVLEGFLCDYFGGLVVHIEQCVGQWVTISEADEIALGERNTQLGLTATIGEQVFDRAGKFRISLGPMKFAMFVRFLPDGDHFQALREIVQLFFVEALDFEVELILLRTDVPELRFSSGMGARLGQTSWLLLERPDDNVSVTIDV